MKIKINVTWSKTVKSLTLFMAIIIILAEFILLLEGSLTNWIVALTAVIIAVVAIFFLLQAPLSVEITDSQVILHKVAGKVAIDYDQIDSVGAYPFHDSDKRVISSGGFCGYTGIFTNRRIGKYYAFVGNKRQAFLIQTKKGENFLFSCTDCGKVVDTIQKAIAA